MKRKQANLLYFIWCVADICKLLQGRLLLNILLYPEALISIPCSKGFASPLYTQLDQGQLQQLTKQEGSQELNRQMVVQLRVKQDECRKRIDQIQYFGENLKMASPQTADPPKMQLTNEQSQISQQFQILSTWPNQDVSFFNSPQMVDESCQPNNLYKRTNLRFYKQFSIESDWQDEQISFFSQLQSPAIGIRFSHRHAFARQKQIRKVPNDQNLNLGFEILSSWSDQHELFFNDLEINRWNNYVKPRRPRCTLQDGQDNTGLAFTILSDWQDEELVFFSGLQRPGCRFQDRREPIRYNRAKEAQDSQQRSKRLDSQKVPYLQRKYNFRRGKAYQHSVPKRNRTSKVQLQPVKKLSLQQILAEIRLQADRMGSDQRRTRSRQTRMAKNNLAISEQPYISRQNIFRNYFQSPKTIAQHFILQLLQENARMQISQNCSIFPLTQESHHSQPKNKQQLNNPIFPSNPRQKYIHSQVNQNVILTRNKLKQAEESPKWSFTSAIMSSDCEFSESEDEIQASEAWPEHKSIQKKSKNNVKNTRLKLDLVIMGLDANELVDQGYEILELLHKQNIFSLEDVYEECAEQSKYKEKGCDGSSQQEQKELKHFDTDKLFRRTILEAMNYYTEQTIKWVQGYYDKTKKQPFTYVSVPISCIRFQQQKIKNKFPRLVAEGEWCYANLILGSNLQYIQYTASNKDRREYLPFVKEHIARQAQKEKYFLAFLKINNDQFWQDLHKSVLQPYARHTTFDSIFQHFMGRLEAVVKKMEGQIRTKKTQGRQKEMEKMFLQRYKTIIARFKSEKPRLNLEDIINELAAITTSAIQKIDSLIQQIAQ